MKRSLAFFAAIGVLLSWTTPVHAQTEGWYVSPQGETVDFEHAWDRRMRRVHGPPAQILRTAAETAGVLAIGALWYWASRDLNSQDWDLPATFESFADRFLSPQYLRFDTNHFWVNEGHVFAGALYYGIGRTNDLGVFGSLASSVVASAAWEWLIEYREFVSVNDLIISPYGGQAMGEPLYRLGELYRLQSESLSLPAKILTAPFAQLRVLHEVFGDPKPSLDVQDGPPMYHDFEMAVGGGVRSSPGEVEEGIGMVSLKTFVADMPGYRRHGQFATWFRDANFTNLDVEFVTAPDFASPTVYVASGTTLAGWYGQNVDEEGLGTSFRAGVGRGVWIDTRPVGRFHDQIGMVDLIGPEVAWDLFSGPFRAKLSLAGYLDFGAVTSLAYKDNRESYEVGTLRSELEREDYYFGLGLSVAPALAMEAGPLSGTFRMRLSRAQDLGGPDRIHHNDIPTLVRLRDGRRRIVASLRYEVWDELAIGARIDGIRRESAIDDAEVAVSATEFSGLLSYGF